VFPYILIGGRFSDDGRSSGYIQRLFDAMQPFCVGRLVNGGTFEELQNLIGELDQYEIIIWMPDVPNDKEKLVKDIKIRYPKSILVISKNNLDDHYTLLELIARALNVKANLFVEFRNPNNNPREIMAGVYDPLGNRFCSSLNIDHVAVTLLSRLFELRKFTRVSSARNDSMIVGEIKPPEDFFSYIRKYAETFHKLIYSHNDNPRFLGNASFRCESGFPSFRADNGIVFMSRRNVDKRNIGVEGFVPTRLITYMGKMWVDYKSEHKPSVDAPIQLLLYRYYPLINFIIHSHTYIQGGALTSRAIPCGAIEEFFEIIQIVPYRYETNIQINLKGHGSLVMVQKLDDLKSIEYQSRPFPENMEPKL